MRFFLPSILTSDSMASLSAMSTSMVVRLFACDWMIALESALMTKRGETPDSPSSGLRARIFAASLGAMPSTSSPAYTRSFFAWSASRSSDSARRESTANTAATCSACGSRCTSRNACVDEQSLR